MTSSAAPLVTLAAADGATAEISPLGAQVCRWRTPDGVQRLYLSERAVFSPGSAIRGGVPVIFPQFGAFGAALRHGFARLLPWQLLECGPRTGATEALARFALADDAVSRMHWPHAFALEMAVRLGGPTLRLALTVRNTDTTPVSFTAALHTYLAIDTLADCRVHGLQQRAFLDNTRGLARSRLPRRSLLMARSTASTSPPTRRCD
jgi:glucose-6-phosphate 1-epimerase